MLILHLIFCKFTWPQNPSLLLSLFNLSSSHFLALQKRILEKTPRSSSFPGVPFYACCSGKVVKSTSFHSYVSQFEWQINKTHAMKHVNYLYQMSNGHGYVTATVKMLCRWLIFICFPQLLKEFFTSNTIYIFKILWTTEFLLTKLTNKTCR